MVDRTLDKWERRFGDWALPNLASLIVGLNAAIYILTLLKPEFPAVLVLRPELVLSGEVWRLLTFLVIPPEMSPFWMFFWLYLLYMYATQLEAEWGDFRFNLYYFIGAAAVSGVSMALGVGLSNVTLNATLFLAFAALYPDFELLLFFILPVQVRWLAWLTWAAMALSFLAGGWAARFGLIAGTLNYFIFFGPRHYSEFRHWLSVRRNRRRYGKAFHDKD